MSDLSEFLLARYAEDEAAALEAMGYESRASVSPAKSAVHYSLWDPDRVHAECEAKRRIVESRPGIASALDEVHDEVQRQREYVFRLLALPYADHPDYREEWRP